MIWLGIILHCIYMDMQDHSIYRVWIHFIPTSLYPRREKTFGLSWNLTQVLLLHKQPLWPLDHGSSGKIFSKQVGTMKHSLFLVWRSYKVVPSCRLVKPQTFLKSPVARCATLPSKKQEHDVFIQLWEKLASPFDNFRVWQFAANNFGSKSLLNIT